jgi:hypothetical protein
MGLFQSSCFSLSFKVNPNKPSDEGKKARCEKGHSQKASACSSKEKKKERVEMPIPYFPLHTRHGLL